MPATANLVLASMTSPGIFHLGERTVKVEGQRECMSIQQPNYWKNQENFSKLQLLFSWEKLVILWPCLTSLLAGRQQLLGKLCYSWFQRQQQFLLSAHCLSPFWGITRSHHYGEEQSHEAGKSQRITWKGVRHSQLEWECFPMYSVQCCPHGKLDFRGRVF